MTGSAPRDAVFVAVGSNVGERLGHLRGGIAALSGPVELGRISSVYETPPAEGAEPPDYLNAVVRGTTGLGPRELLELLLGIEEEAGRDRRHPGAPRTLDLDLVYHGSRVVDEPGLRLPHPRRLERSFVLGPLAEIAPAWRDPETGRSLGYEWRRRRPGPGPLERVAPPSIIAPSEAGATAGEAREGR